MDFERNSDLAAELKRALVGEALEEYLSHAVRLVWDSIPHEPSEHLQIAGFAHVDSNTIFATRAGITVGLLEVRRLNQGCLELAEALTVNYVARAAPMSADVPGPSAFISLDDFPDAALLAASGWEPDGYTLPTHEGMMLFAERAVSGSAPGARPILPELPFMHQETFAAKGDFVRFLETDNGMYLIRLHHRILRSVLALVLAHEVGHIRLSHFDKPPSSRRQAEADADRFAIDTLRADAPIAHLSALRTFLLLHEREQPAAKPLSHPYSRDRMQLLGRALVLRGIPRALRDEISALLRHLRVLKTRGRYRTRTSVGTTGVAEMAFEVASDLDGLELTVRTFEPDSMPPERLAKEALDLKIHEVLQIDLTYRDPIDSRVYATGHVDMVPLDWPVAHSHRNGTMQRIFRFPISTPPMWRADHAGILDISSITMADENTVVAVAKQVIESKRPLVWPYETEALLAVAALRAGVSMKDRDPVDMLEWAVWCKEYGYLNESIALRGYVTETTPIIAGYATAISLINDLRATGHVQRAGEIASAYMREITWLRPGMHLALAEAALERRESLQAFEHAFIEIHGCGDTGPFFKDANAVFLKSMSDTSSKEIAILKDWFQKYRDADTLVLRLVRPLRRRWLTMTMAPLTDLLAQHRTLISLRQLWAEGLASLEAAGDREAGRNARAMFDELIAECPWFVGALVQAAYAARRDGDAERASRLLRNAEDISPFHHHVREARDVIVNPSDRYRQRPV